MNIAAILFAPDGETTHRDIVGRLIAGYYVAAASSIIECARRADLVAHDDLFLLPPSSYDNEPERLWTPEVGFALELSLGGAPLASTALAQLALANACYGCNQDTSLGTATFVSLQFSGVPLPPTSSIRIVSAPDEVTIIIGDLEFRFVRRGTFWASDDASDYIRVPAPTVDLMVTGDHCVDMALISSDQPVIGPAIFSDAVSSICTTFDLIDRGASQYSLWVRRLLRQVHALGQMTRGDRVNSRSYERRPGIVVATAPRNPIFLGDVIVHETSHQHFFLLQRVTRLTTENASGLKFMSALNGKWRDMDRILVAYHAVANMLIYHAAIAKSGLIDPTVAKDRFEYLKSVGRDYLTTIAKNSSLLSADGLAFWEPGAAQIHELCA
jgi:hypothetical protein